MRREAERAPGRPAVADPDAPPAAARQPTCTRRGQYMLAWVDWRLALYVPGDAQRGDVVDVRCALDAAKCDEGAVGGNRRQRSFGATHELRGQLIVRRTAGIASSPIGSMFERSSVSQTDHDASL